MGTINEPQGQHAVTKTLPQQQTTNLYGSLMPNSSLIDKVSVPLWQHVMQTEMALTTILQERVSEGLNALLESALTWISLKCNPRYVGGLHDLFLGYFVDSKPKTRLVAVELATDNYGHVCLYLG
ncbi:hypothetical protein Tco_1370130 [Tanacetum coccineum]